MQFVDSHCHLNYESYRQDVQEVIRRAVDQGVYRIIVPGLDLESSRKAVELAQRFEPVYAAVGVHPNDVDGFTEEQLPSFVELISFPKVVAVGEIGLDYYHRQDNQPLQHLVLELFLHLALEYKKPVIFHSRECLRELIQTVTNFNIESDESTLRGIFHAFEGGLQDANKVTETGFYLGAGGSVTYPNSVIKHELFSKIDLSHVMLETDAPFLSPQRYRGQRNEPGYIPLIAEKVAELQQCDIKEVALITTSNANTLFNWT